MCGKGKTSWAIQEMNRHREQSYIYVTPLLDEVERIRTHTTEQFFEPIYNGARKIDNFNDLLCKGENIATTHSTFANSDDETMEYIQQGNYVLILDEVIDVLGPFNDICKDPAQRIKKGDIKLLKDKNLIDVDDYGYNVPIKLDTVLQKENVPDTVKTKRKAVIRTWVNGNLQQSSKRI